MSVVKPHARQDVGLSDGDKPIHASICLLAAMTIAVPLDNQARLTLFDIVASALLVTGWRQTRGLFSGFALALAISLAAMAASVYWHESGLLAFLGRSYSSILLFVEVMGMYILASRTTETGRAALVLGAMLGISAHYFYPNDLRILDNPIKFLLGIPLGTAAMAGYALLAQDRQVSALPAASLMVAYSLFCFLAGSRSIGGVFFAAGMCLMLLPYIRVGKRYGYLAPIMMVAFGIGLYSFAELYTFFALKGFFGNTAANIAAFQSSFGSTLVGGRPEIIVNLIGIGDSPIFGVGIGNYPTIYLYEMIRLSVYSESTVLELDNILYHSAIFATAFESGIPSALFWAMAFYLALFAIPLLRTMPVGQRAYVLPLLLVTGWHLLYSPPISYNRFVMAPGLAFAFYAYAAWLRERRGELVAAPQDTANLRTS